MIPSRNKKFRIPIGTNVLGYAYYNNKIYLVGFMNDPRNLVYSTTSDSWDYLESLPGSRVSPSFNI